MATAKQPDKQLYPGPRRPRPNECWPRLMRAAAALDTMDARIPWHDPTTGRGGLRRVVSMGDIPRGPDALDDNVRFVVDLPPGSGPGPVVPPTLGAWGARSAPAYTALLNLAYRWFDPGVTRYPVGGGHWLQTLDPKRYPELTDTDVVNITRPLTARADRRHLVSEGWGTLRELEAARELRIDGRRVFAPRTAPGLAPPGRDVHPSTLGRSPRLTDPGSPQPRPRPGCAITSLVPVAQAAAPPPGGAREKLARG